MEITHHGHSCLLVETPGARVLIDPGNFSDFDAVRDLSAVLVTHQHPDHADPQRLGALLEANPEAEVYVEPQTAIQVPGLSDRALLLGSKPVVIGDLEVTPVGDKHAVIHPYVERIDNRGLVMRAQGTSLFHPGDAFDAEVGDIDILCVPINAPWQAVKEAIEFVRRIQPGLVVPIHDGLLKGPGREMYLKHIRDYGVDGGVDVRDLAGEEATASF